LGPPTSRIPVVKDSTFIVEVLAVPKVSRLGRLLAEPIDHHFEAIGFSVCFGNCLVERKELPRG